MDRFLEPLSRVPFPRGLTAISASTAKQKFRKSTAPDEFRAVLDAQFHWVRQTDPLICMVFFTAWEHNGLTKETRACPSRLSDRGLSVHSAKPRW